MRMLFPRDDQDLHLLREDSHSSATLAKVQSICGRAGARRLLLFIDGDHTYEGVKSDFKNLLATRPRGCPDRLPRHPEAPSEAWGRSRIRYWNEIKAGHRHVGNRLWPGGRGAASECCGNQGTGESLTRLPIPSVLMPPGVGGPPAGPVHRRGSSLRRIADRYATDPRGAPCAIRRWLPQAPPASLSAPARTS